MRNTSGFTLLELLIVIGMIGVLSAIGFTSIGGLRRSQDLEQAAATLSQSIQRARAQSMSTSSSWQVRITDSDTFMLEQNTSSTSTPVWTNRNTTDLPGTMTFNNFAGDTIRFNSRGIASFLNDSTGSFSTTDSTSTSSLLSSMRGFKIQVGGTVKLTLYPSLIGTVKTVKQ